MMEPLKQAWKVVVTALFVLAMLVFAVAQTTIFDETGVTSPSGSYTNLTVTGTATIKVGLNANPNNTAGTGTWTLIDDGGYAVTVCDSGCNYTTIMGAINDVPWIIRSEYVINVQESYSGDEDVVVKPVIVGDVNTGGNEEGFCGGLTIQGNASSEAAVTVNSFLVGSSLGCTAVYIRYFTVDGVDPRSDEDPRVAVYGSKGTVLLDNLTVSGATINSTYAIMAYGADVRAEGIKFGTDTNNYCMLAKSGGRIYVNNLERFTGQCINSSYYVWGDGFMSLKGADPLSSPLRYDGGWGLVHMVDSTEHQLYGVDYLNLTKLYFQSMKAEGNIDMAANLIQNIGVAGTSFTAGGGLDVTSHFNVGSTDFQVDVNANKIKTFGAPAKYAHNFNGEIGMYGNDVGFHINDTSDNYEWILYAVDGGFGIYRKGILNSYALYVEPTTNRVCIGCTNPSETFEVRGNANIDGNISALGITTVPGGTDGCTLKWNGTTGAVYC